MHFKIVLRWLLSVDGALAYSMFSCCVLDLFYLVHWVIFQLLFLKILVFHGVKMLLWSQKPKPSQGKDCLACKAVTSLGPAGESRVGRLPLGFTVRRREIAQSPAYGMALDASYASSFQLMCLHTRTHVQHQPPHLHATEISIDLYQQIDNLDNCSEILRLDSHGEGRLNHKKWTRTWLRKIYEVDQQNFMLYDGGSPTEFQIVWRTFFSQILMAFKLHRFWFANTAHYVLFSINFSHQMCILNEDFFPALYEEEPLEGGLCEKLGTSFYRTLVYSITWS